MILDHIQAEKENFMAELEHLWFKYKGWWNRLLVKASQVL